MVLEISHERDVPGVILVVPDALRFREEDRSTQTCIDHGEEQTAAASQANRRPTPVTGEPRRSCPGIGEARRRRAIIVSAAALTQRG